MTAMTPPPSPSARTSGPRSAGQHRGPHVLDVERAPDRLARVARLAAQQHRLDARVEQPLHRRARAGAKPVLQRDEAHQAIAERDQQHAAPLPFELGHAPRRRPRRRSSRTA